MQVAIDNSKNYCQYYVLIIFSYTYINIRYKIHLRPTLVHFGPEKLTSDGNNLNIFPENQLNKFRVFLKSMAIPHYNTNTEYKAETGVYHLGEGS